MCDFRKILEITFDDGTIMDVSTDTKRASALPIGQTIPGVFDISEVTVPGFYHVIASGGWDMYFDGDHWIRENAGYTVTSHEHHQLT